jgi:two-component system response regulator DegU
MAEKPAILVVDDDVDVADDIAEILEKTGKYQVFKAHSGQEAIKIIDEKNKGLIKLDRVKLVLLDIRMPDLNGIETLRKINDIDEDVRAIMVTAYDVDDYWINSVFVNGAIAYILKPYKEDDMLQKIEQHFKGRANVLHTQAMYEYIADRNEKDVARKRAEES